MRSLGATARPVCPTTPIAVELDGAAGQSFGAWLANGVTLTLRGEANDYVGKGLSGGRLVIVPPERATRRAEDNIIIGNVALYGATVRRGVHPRRRR